MQEGPTWGPAAVLGAGTVEEGATETAGIVRGAAASTDTSQRQEKKVSEKRPKAFPPSHLLTSCGGLHRLTLVEEPEEYSV